MCITLLLFATEIEALPTIKALGARALSPTSYQFDRGFIVISGMGIQAAINTLILWAPKVDLIINLGIAASLKEGTLGEIVEVGKVGSQAASPFTFSTKSALYSSRYPIHCAQKRALLQREWDLVDMEGYGVVVGAQFFDKPFQIFKVISDFALPGGSTEILKNINHCATVLSDFSVKELVQK